jgi:hypothetical protein
MVVHSRAQELFFLFPSSPSPSLSLIGSFIVHPGTVVPGLVPPLQGHAGLSLADWFCHDVNDLIWSPAGA